MTKPIKKIYIASSWRHQHAVELLTTQLRAQGYEIISWIENNYGENHNHVTKKFDFETWVGGPESDQSFEYDTTGAMSCDLFIYVGQAGKDAAAESGMAFAKGKHMIGLHQKGEDFGLMRKMFSHWFTRTSELLEYTEKIKSQNNIPENVPAEKGPDILEICPGNGFNLVESTIFNMIGKGNWKPTEIDQRYITDRMEFKCPNHNSNITEFMISVRKKEIRVNFLEPNRSDLYVFSAKQVEQLKEYFTIHNEPTPYIIIRERTAEEFNPKTT